MSFAIKDSAVVLIMSPRKAAQLVAGVSDIAAGKGDYSLSGMDQDVEESIWFWWYPEMGRK